MRFQNIVEYLFLPVITAFIFLLITSCESTTSGEPAQAAEASSIANRVEILVVEEKDFIRELVSNGKLRAKRKSRLQFGLSEELIQINVTNGQKVMAGETLAILNSSELKQKKQQTGLLLQRATLDLEDILVGRGYALSDSLNIPPDIMQVASIRSGYAEAKNELNNIINDLKKTTLKAPYNGIIAGIESQVFEKANPGDIFCTIIDNSSFIVEFYIMENELQHINKNSRLRIIPFAFPDKSFSGKLKSINPVVNQHGQIKITATVEGEQSLLDGMNVRVIVEEIVPNQLVVPKSSVLYRDNLLVLFKYKSGEAYWTYVNILMENSEYFSVKANPDRVASIEAGDTVIISNNLNLAHGSKVEIDE